MSLLGPIVWIFWASQLWTWSTAPYVHNKRVGITLYLYGFRYIIHQI
jgi:hypothetical protein